MSPNTEVAILIQGLNRLSPQLLTEKDQGARKEALRLSKALTTVLEDPVNVATDLAFAVCVTCSQSRFYNLSGR
jgi:hypothetical protein